MSSLIAAWGPLGVFVLMIPESACIPVPSEVTLLFAGFAVHSGWMSMPLAVLAAAGGNLVGSLLAYALGAWGPLGRAPVLGRALAGSGGLLDRHGTRAVFIARLLPLARTFVSLPAGARRIPLLPFVALTFAGCVLWALALTSAGVLAGTSWSAVGSWLGRAGLCGAALALLVFALRRRARGGGQPPAGSDPA